jgi:hypothetical protein
MAGLDPAIHALPPSPSILAAGEAALKGKALRADADASPLTATPPAAGAKTGRDEETPPTEPRNILPRHGRA